MRKKSFRDLTTEEQDFIAQGKPKPLQTVAKEAPAAPAKEPAQLVAYRWPASLVRELMEQCHRRKMDGLEPYTQREITAQALRDWLDKQAK